MVEEYIHGQMDVNMKENIFRIKNKGMVFISGQMEEVILMIIIQNMKVTGVMENNLEKADIYYLLARNNQGYGNLVVEFNGQMIVRISNPKVGMNIYIQN